MEDNLLTDTASDTTAAVAARVRSLRTARGWSLDELAGRSGVSKGMVVHIEGGRTNPSLGTLCRLADAFGVTIVELLEPATERRVHIRDSADAPELWRGEHGGSGRLLAGVGDASVVELWDWRMEPGETHPSPFHSPGTRELVHVLSGTLRVTIGETQYDVRAGQTIDFVADRPHIYENPGTEVCRTSMVVAMAVGEYDRRTP